MKSIVSSVLLTISLIIACNLSEAAENKPATMPTSATPTAEPPRLAADGPTSYPATTHPGRILAGDLLGVEVSDLMSAGSASTFPVQVAADGSVLLPFLEKPVAVAGMATWAAGKVINAEYRKENIIQNANVWVRRLRIAGTGGPPVGQIGNYDLVRIVFIDIIAPGSMTVRVERVDGEGMVSVPYLERKKIAGMTDQKAASVIGAALSDANITKRPLVSVVRLEAAPPDAGRVDLPDAPIYPVPEVLRWMYELGDVQPARGLPK